MKSLETLLPLLSILILIFLLGNASAAIRTVTGCTLNLPSSDPNIEESETFIYKASPMFSGTGLYPSITHTAQVCNNSTCSSAPDINTIPTDTAVTSIDWVSAESEDTNPVTFESSSSQDGTVKGRTVGIYYVRCKITSTNGCGEGCYSVPPQIITVNIPSIPEILYKSCSGDCGVASNWSNDVNISSNTGRSNNPSLAISNDNKVHVVWHDNTSVPSNSVRYKNCSSNCDINESWGNDFNVNDANGTYPVIAFDSDNNVHVLYMDDNTGTTANRDNINSRTRTSLEIWDTNVLKTNDLQDNTYPSVKKSTQVGTSDYLDYVYTKGLAADYNIVFAMDVLKTPAGAPPPANRVADTNVVKIDGNLDSGGLPRFWYNIDKNITIDFNVSDKDCAAGVCSNIDANIDYRDVNGANYRIITNLELTTAGICNDTQFNSDANGGTTCRWDWNIMNIGDSNFWIDVNVTDNNGSQDSSSSDQNFRVIGFTFVANREIDVNVVKIDGNPDNLALKTFDYDVDGNITIDFNVYDADCAQGVCTNLDANIDYRDVNGQSYRIITNLELTNADRCNDTDFASNDNNIGTTCRWDWNNYSVPDSNFWIDVNVTDNNTSTDFNRSDNNFFAGRGTIPIDNQKIDVNITKIDGNNALVPIVNYFYYNVDKNLTIDFNITDLDCSTGICTNIDANIDYRDINGESYRIITNLELTTAGRCDDTDFTTSTKCSWDWNSIDVPDSNFWIDVNATDNNSSQDTNTTASHFFVGKKYLAPSNNVPTLEITKLDGNLDNQALPSFRYNIDKNITIDFNAGDIDINGCTNCRLDANIDYRDVNGESTRIITDLNLMQPNICNDQNFAGINANVSVACRWDWNIIYITDSNYWIDVNVTDNNGATTLDISDSNFRVNPLAPPPAPPNRDINIIITKIDNNLDNGGLPKFNYYIDGNITIDFNVYDGDCNGNCTNLDANIDYRDVNGESYRITTNLELTTVGRCNDTNFSNDKNKGATCHYDWNIISIRDSNFWIDVNVTDNNTSQDFNRSDQNFRIQNIQPIPNNPIDVNVVAIDNNPDINGLPTFNYFNDGNLTIDFNVFDKDCNGLFWCKGRLDANLDWRDVNGESTRLATDLNLMESGRCDDQNFARASADLNIGTTCHWDFNIMLIPDTNVFIDVNVTDNNGSEDFNRSDQNFRIRNRDVVLSASPSQITEDLWASMGTEQRTVVIKQNGATRTDNLDVNFNCNAGVATADKNVIVSLNAGQTDFVLITMTPTGSRGVFDCSLSIGNEFSSITISVEIYDEAITTRGEIGGGGPEGRKLPPIVLPEIKTCWELLEPKAGINLSIIQGIETTEDLKIKNSCDYIINNFRISATRDLAEIMQIKTLEREDFRIDINETRIFKLIFKAKENMKTGDINGVLLLGESEDLNAAMQIFVKLEIVRASMENVMLAFFTIPTIFGIQLRWILTAILIIFMVAIFDSKNYNVWHLLGIAISVDLLILMWLPLIINPVWLFFFTSIVVVIVGWNYFYK